MQYEFDPAKAAANLAKHGVSFEAAIGFNWDNAMISAQIVENEVRFIALGLVGIIAHVLVFADLGLDRIRIISLRKATRRENRIYDGSR